MAICRLYSFLFATSLLCYIPVTSQTLKRLNHTSYNVNEGLLHSQVIDLAEDGNGFIWISTGSGVQRFDGKSFLQVSVTNDSRGIPDDKYVDFFRLQTGNVWFRHSKGISEYDIHTDRFRDIIRSDKTNADSIPFPVLEQNDGIWCRLFSGGLYLLDKKKLHFTDSISFPANRVYQDIITVNSQKDDVLFSGFSETAIYITGKKPATYSSFHPGKMQGKFIGLADYKPDTLLVATQRGIEKMDIRSGKFVFVCPYKTTSPALATAIYIKLYPLKNSNYLVSEGREIYELNVQRAEYISRLVSLQNQNFLNVGLIGHFFSDSHNNCWILSENDGICKVDYRFSGFRYYGTDDKRKNFIKTIYADKNDNRVLCGTAGNGLLVFDTLQQLIKTIDQFPGAIAPHTIGAIQKTAPQRYLLFLTGGWKVYLLNTQTFSLLPVRVDTGHIRLGNVFDYHINIFRISDTESIMQNSYQICKLKWQLPASVLFTTSTDISTASISSYIDPQHRLWAGGRWKYFLFTNGIESYKSFDLPEKIIVRCFYTDAAGRIWMGTEKGLFQLDKEGKVIKKLYRPDGLADENIYSLRGDKTGNLWISHNKGISCMTTTGNFFHYNKYDGLQENEFNTNSFFETADGELFFGGVNGVSSFYPEAILQYAEQPKLFITSIKIKDTEWQTDTAVWNVGHIDLPYFKNNLAFEFTALGVRQPDQYNYQFRMQGADESWVNSVNRGTARYVLPPGKYVFELYAGNSFSKDATPLKRIFITIRPPFWKTNLFIVLAIAFLAVIIIMITRWLTRMKLKRLIEELERKRALDEERLRISREMHDDIGAGLTQITMMSEAAKSKPQNEQQLDKIANTSRKLVSDMSEIIWSMSPEQNTLDQLLAYLREQLRQLLEYSGIEYKIDFPENGSNVLLNNAQKRNLLLVAKEIVHNAVKHSKAKHLFIVGEQKKSLLQFTITDDGCGFEINKPSHGNGLRNIKRRIEELGGALKVESVPEKGSRFSYQIPLMPV